MCRQLHEIFLFTILSAVLHMQIIILNCVTIVVFWSLISFSMFRLASLRSNFHFNNTFKKMEIWLINGKFQRHYESEHTIQI